jgi:predicted pyridoxine 5'-phosphate oxidase superfamily flavin-nucleotide-binding protein
MQERSGPERCAGAGRSRVLAEADSFFLATVSETGWPYVQHRGGPAGFVKVLSPTTLGFADFRGNLQHVSTGNALGDDRASIIVVDYARRRRLKLSAGCASWTWRTPIPELVRRVELPGYLARVERVALFEVAAFRLELPAAHQRRASRKERSMQRRSRCATGSPNWRHASLRRSRTPDQRPPGNTLRRFASSPPSAACGAIPAVRRLRIEGTGGAAYDAAMDHNKT